MRCYRLSLNNSEEHKLRLSLVALAIPFLLAGCVSKRKYDRLSKLYELTMKSYAEDVTEWEACQKQLRERK